MAHKRLLHTGPNLLGPHVCFQTCLSACRFVDFDMGSQTAASIGSIRQWVTNEYMHSGLRDDGSSIFDRLLGMTRNSIPLY